MARKAIFKIKSQKFYDMHDLLGETVYSWFWISWLVYLKTYDSHNNNCLGLGQKSCLAAYLKKDR